MEDTLHHHHAEDILLQHHVVDTLLHQTEDTLLDHHMEDTFLRHHITTTVHQYQSLCVKCDHHVCQSLLSLLFSLLVLLEYAIIIIGCWYPIYRNCFIVKKWLECYMGYTKQGIGFTGRGQTKSAVLVSRPNPICFISHTAQITML